MAIRECPKCGAKMHFYDAVDEFDFDGKWFIRTEQWECNCSYREEVEFNYSLVLDGAEKVIWASE